jgi:phage-related protein
MATVAEVLTGITRCENVATAGIAILNTAARTLASAALLSCATLGTVGALLNPSLKSLAKKIEQTIGRALSALTDLICVAKAILIRLQKFFRALRKFITDLLTAALTIIKNILDSIVAVFNFITDLIKSIIDDLLGAITALANQLINWIKSLLTINCGVSIRALTSGDPCATVAEEVQDALIDALNTTRNSADFSEELANTYGGNAKSELTSLDQLSEFIKRKIDDSIQTFKNSITSAIDNMERVCGALLAK